MICHPSRHVVLPLVLLTGVTLAGCSSSSSKKSAGAPAPAPAAATPAPGAASAATLKIAGFAYAPTPLTVAPGARVPVSNSDSAEHTVTSDTSGLFLSGDVAQGKTVTMTAPGKPGTYTYHCKYHSSMHGTLVVKR